MNNRPLYPLLRSYVWTTMLVLLITIIGKVLGHAFDMVNMALLYLLPVLVSAVRWGMWPSLLASLLGILAFDFFFVPPFLSLAVADFRHLLDFAVLLVVALVTSTLAARLHDQAEKAKERERKTAQLYALSHRIAAETDLTTVLQTIAKALSTALQRDVAVCLPQPAHDRILLVTHNGIEDSQLDEKEYAIVRWVLEHRQAAGRGTETLEGANRHFFPIANGSTGLAVFAVSLEEEQVLTEEEHNHLEALASLTALAITRFHLSEEAEQAKWLVESEKLHKALLNAVSHDLRTPLSSIIGAATGLLSEGALYDGEARTALLKGILGGAQRMNRFVANLLDTARLESGILQPKREWCDIEDILGVALKEIRGMIPEHRITTAVPPDLPLVEADFALIEQVVINLLENAIKYSPPESTIAIIVSTTNAELTVAIEDKGPPILQEDGFRIFDKFYRLRTTQHVSGTGLGLSICKGIVEAHGGRIWVEPHAQEGNIFFFALPITTGQPRTIPVGTEEENHGI